MLSYASAGYLDKQIGQELGVSLNTLRTYWQRIRTKIGEAPRSALAVAYVQHVSIGSSTKPNGSAGKRRTIPVIQVPEAQVSEGIFDRTPDWEIDLEHDLYTAFTPLPFGIDRLTTQDLPFEEVLSYFHPEDQPRLRSLVVSARSGELDEFCYSGRLVTPSGVKIASAMIRVQRDKAGHPVKCHGWRIARPDHEPSPVQAVSVGHWTRDLLTGRNTYDRGFRSIFRLPGATGDLRELALARFHPDEFESAKRLLEEATAASRERVRATSRLKFDDGTEQWVVISLAIKYENGEPRGVTGTVTAC